MNLDRAGLKAKPKSIKECMKRTRWTDGGLKFYFHVLTDEENHFVHDITEAVVKFGSNSIFPSLPYIEWEIRRENQRL